MDIIYECNMQDRFRKFNMAKMTRTFCRCIATGGTFLARFEGSQPIIHKSTLYWHTILIIGFGSCYFCYAELPNFHGRPNTELYAVEDFYCFFHFSSTPNDCPYTF